ncbi:MAG: heavy-metal-associated domain-containing protein [Clostridia bacterium]|nr:heavy-metal-associated domain-containing protein [Clostridia bacterium]
MKKQIIIEGMSCGHCTGRVEKALNSLENVKVIEMSLEKKSAFIEVEHVSDELLIEAVEDAGYDVVSIE